MRKLIAQNHFLVLIALLLTGCTDFFEWEAPETGVLLSKEKSPDLNYSAKIIASDVKGTYVFIVTDNQTNNIVTEQTISAPVGYHKQIVLLQWEQSSKVVSAIIDHDLGENNMVFRITLGNKSI